MQSVFLCPNCQSENVQKCSIIYQSGTSGSDSATVADKFIAVTKGATMTNLARELAPPQMKEISWGWVIFWAVCAFICLGESTILFLCGLMLCGFFLKDNLDKQNYNDKIFPVEYNLWLHSYFCHRCGNIFVVM